MTPQTSTPSTPARSSDLVTISAPPRARRILKQLAVNGDRRISDLAEEAVLLLAEKHGLDPDTLAPSAPPSGPKSPT